MDSSGMNSPTASEGEDEANLLLEALMEGPPWPMWLDKLFVRFIGLIQFCLLLVGGLIVSAGFVMSAGLAPSWTATAIILIGFAIAASAGFALYAIHFRRPALLSYALAILIGVVVSVATAAGVLYVLVAQVDSPVTEYVICNWRAELEKPNVLAICSKAEQAAPAYNCTDGEADLSLVQTTRCQKRLVDRLHDDLTVVNGIAYWEFIVLLLVCQVNRKVIAQYHETDEPPDPFTKFVVVVLLVVAFCISSFLVSLTIVLWQYSWTSAMFCFLGSLAVVAVVAAVYLLLRNRKQLFIASNGLLVLVELVLLPCCIFGGFFTGDLQSVTEMYHENWEHVFAEINKVFPGVCNGLTESQCKEKVKELTMDQLDNALLGCACLLILMVFVTLTTWRVVVTFQIDMMSLHGLSNFELSTLEKTVFLDRETIMDAADLFWEVLHHPHRPINETIMMAHQTQNAEDTAKGDKLSSHYGKLELELKDKERVRLRKLRKTALRAECVAKDVNPMGTTNQLRARLLQHYSRGRMLESHRLANNTSGQSDVDFAEQHFFQLGEPELRLIPCFAWCPFLERLIHIFSEDGSGFLHFEEFLNIYSVFSRSCPVETKIRYAWCIYDMDSTGDIRTQEVRAIVLHVLGIDEEDLLSPRDEQNPIEALEDDLDTLEQLDALDLSDRVRGGKKKAKNPEEDPNAKAIWDSLDTDGSGNLDEAEVRLIFELMGNELTEKDFRKAFKQMDRDHSGSVEYFEFQRWLAKQSSEAQQRLADQKAVEEEDLAALSELDLLSSMGDSNNDQVGEDDPMAMLDSLDVRANPMPPSSLDIEDLAALEELGDEVENTSASKPLPERLTKETSDDSEQKKGRFGLKFENPMGMSMSMLGKTDEELERERQRREELRREELNKFEIAHKQERDEQQADVAKFLEVVMQEVDEDGDEILNFHEFRKALLRSPDFDENFQMLHPRASELLNHPNAEDSSEEDDHEEDTVLTAEEKMQMRIFAAGHRRRKASLEAEEKAKADAEAAMRAAETSVRNPMLDGAEADKTTVKKKKVSKSLRQRKEKRRKAAEMADARKRQVWEKYKTKQEAAKSRENVKQLVDNTRPQHLNETRNPERPRSIYTQLVIARQEELQDLVRRQRKRQMKKEKKALKRSKKEEKRRNKQSQNGDSQSSANGESGSNDAAAESFLDLAHFGGVDWESMNVEDINESIAGKTIREFVESVRLLLQQIGILFNRIQNQDMIPIWRHHIRKVEGEFGAGISSVFILHRWMFAINGYMALTWFLFVILPYLAIKFGGTDVEITHFRYTNESLFQSTNYTFTKPINSTWKDFYKYSAYPPQLGAYRMDMAYLGVVLLLYLANVIGVVRNIAYTLGVNKQNEIYGSDHSYTATALLFSAHDFRSSTRKIVLQHQKSTGNEIKTVLMKQRAAEAVASGGLMGRIRRTVGFTVSLTLAFGMGYLIILIIRNQVWLQENVRIPNITNNLITAIKIIIPKLIPPIVKMEKRMDTSDIMDTMITRIYVCQMVSLAVMFRELHSLQLQAASRNECFEDIASDIYTKSTITDFAANLVQTSFAWIKKQKIYFKLYHGGYLGKKQSVPTKLARLLTKERLPQYDAKEAALEVISMMYRQAIIWVGATVSPTMAILGTVANYLLFYLTKWKIMHLNRPPNNPWGAAKAKATYAKFLFVTLIFCGAPLVAWLTRAPICGAHAGVVVISTYQQWLETEASPVIKNTIGAVMVFALQGPPLFCLLAVATITIYFQNSQNSSLAKVIDTLKTDFQREHHERVSIVEAAMKFQDAGFVLPPPWDEDMQKENELLDKFMDDKIHGEIWQSLDNPDKAGELTWEDVQKFAEILHGQTVTKNVRSYSENKAAGVENVGTRFNSYNKGTKGSNRSAKVKNQTAGRGKVTNPMMDLEKLDDL